MAKRTKPTVTPPEVNREAWLRAQLATIEQDLQDARDARSFQAVASLHRQANVTRDALDKTLAASSAVVDATAGMDDEEIVRSLIAAITVLPDQVVERIEAAIEARYAGRPAFAVLSGGSDAR